MCVGTTHNKIKSCILDIADVRVVTGDVDIVEYSIGRGMAPVHSGSAGTQPLYIKIIKSGISDIIIGESCDMEMESGGQWLRVTRHLHSTHLYSGSLGK